MDLDRIGTRNLGRDDRIISYHGKEARYPFLDEEFVKFVIAIPVWLKCDLRGKEGVGEKLLLRCVAKELGLSEASLLKKRAIHFGKLCRVLWRYLLIMCIRSLNRCQNCQNGT